jgi:hypothetical protein
MSKSETIVSIPNADEVNFVMTIGIGASSLDLALEIRDAFKSGIGSVQRADEASGAADQLEAVKIFVSDPVPLSGRPFGRNPAETAALDIIRELLETAALSTLTNRLYCDSGFCACCESSAPKDDTGRLTGLLEHRPDCVLGRARALVSAPRFKCEPPANVAAQFLGFSERVAKALPPSHAAWARERSAAIHAQLKAFGSKEAPDGHHAAADLDVANTASAFQEFVYRAVSQMPFDLAAWANERAAIIFDQIKAQATPSAANEDAPTSDDSDPLDEFMQTFDEKLGDYVESCLGRAQPDAGVEGALVPRDLYNALRDHVRAVAPAGLYAADVTEARFREWWTTPNRRTGHPPSAILDEHSARAAWFDSAQGACSQEHSVG